MRRESTRKELSGNGMLFKTGVWQTAGDEEDGVGAGRKNWDIIRYCL